MKETKEMKEGRQKDDGRKMKAMKERRRIKKGEGNEGGKEGR